MQCHMYEGLDVRGSRGGDARSLIPISRTRMLLRPLSSQILLRCAFIDCDAVNSEVISPPNENSMGLVRLGFVYKI